jgi:hypothetical protein
MSMGAARAGSKRSRPRLDTREAHAIGDPPLIAAKYWPDFAELREDPRFQEILKCRGEHSSPGSTICDLIQSLRTCCAMHACPDYC